MLADLGAQALGAVTYGIYPTASTAETEYQLRDGGAPSSSPRTRSTSTRSCPSSDRLPRASPHRGHRHLGPVRLRPSQAPRLGHAARIGGRRTRRKRSRRWSARGAARSPTGPPSSSTLPARPGIRKARSWPMAGISPAPTTSSSITRCSPSRSARSSICRSAMASGRDVAMTLPLLSRAGAALRRGRRGPDADHLRGRPYGAVHGTALSAEVRLPHRSSPCRRQRSQAPGIRTRHAGRSPARARALGGARRRARRVPTRSLAPLAFRPLLNKLGLDALQLVISGGAPLPPETMALWQIWGVNVCEIYGQTEEAGAHHHRPARSVPAPRRRRHARARLGAEARRVGRDPHSRRARVRGIPRATRRPRARSAATMAGCAPATSANGRTAGCASSIARATSSSPPAARRCRRPTSRTPCARAPTSPRWRCSDTPAST